MNTTPVQNWPEWSTPDREIDILRRAVHQMARDILQSERLPDYVFREEQAVVDYYIARERTKG